MKIRWSRGRIGWDGVILLLYGQFSSLVLDTVSG